MVARRDASSLALCLLLLITLVGCGSAVSSEAARSAGGAAGASGASGAAGAAGTQPQERAATPELSLPPGTYDIPQQVEAHSSSPEAVVHYTIDGSDPTPSSQVYDEPIQLAEGSTTTLKAFATAPGLLDSMPVEATYVIAPATLDQAEAPQFSWNRDLHDLSLR